MRLFIRHHLLARGESRPHNFPRKGRPLCFCWWPRREAVRILEGWLTEEEKEVVKTGEERQGQERTQKRQTPWIIDYSTGFGNFDGTSVSDRKTNDRLTQGMKQVIQSLEGALEDEEI